MQALTVAIGPAGIDYFAQRLVAVDLANTLKTLKPPNNDLTIPNFNVFGFGYSASYSNIKITLRNGSLASFNPVYAPPVGQNTGGKFGLTLTAANFTSNYKWHESYHEFVCYSGGEFPPPCRSGDPTGDYDYGPNIGLLNTAVTLAFEFNQGTQTYDIKVVGSNGQSTNVTANIPARSIVQQQDQGCFTSKVSDATAQAISSIDFAGEIAKVLPPLLKSIPASGNLTNDIFYDFGLGDSGLEFPADNKGIKIGVTGKVRYRNEEYPGTPPPPLPVPPPPLDANHLQTYVSAYEVNALHWAYFKAGLLNVLVTPSDLPDPDVLKVKTYVALIPSFKPYQAFAMNAYVKPLEPPVVAFQEVYQFTGAAMASLFKQLPANVYAQIQGLEGDGYITLAELEEALTYADVPAQYFNTIRDATKGMGMAVVQNIQFTLTIQNNADLPNVIFSVRRTDILDNLGLGITGTAQTMKYQFQKVRSVATFESSTVPKFDSKNFGDIIWPIAGEPRYSQTLAAMGETGVPIPIMSGFQFLFQEAQLSIQQGYVSILAKVTFKAAAMDAEHRDAVRRR